MRIKATRKRNALLNKFNLIVVGSVGVGKSCLTTRFICDKYVPDAYEPTIEDIYKKQFVIDDEPTLLEIFDSAGDTNKIPFLDGDGFLCVYDVTNRISFEEAIATIEYLRRIRPDDDLPITLVGAKCDKEDLRVIEYMEGRGAASELKCSFMETSSAWNHNCADVFVQLVRQSKLTRLKKLQRKNSDESKKLKRANSRFLKKKNSEQKLNRLPSSSSLPLSANTTANSAAGACVIM